MHPSFTVHHRYGFLGITDVSLPLAFGLLTLFTLALAGFGWCLIRTGLGLKQ